MSTVVPRQTAAVAMVTARQPRRNSLLTINACAHLASLKTPVVVMMVVASMTALRIERGCISVCVTKGALAVVSRTPRVSNHSIQLR